MRVGRLRIPLNRRLQYPFRLLESPCMVERSTERHARALVVGREADGRLEVFDALLVLTCIGVRASENPVDLGGTRRRGCGRHEAREDLLDIAVAKLCHVRAQLLE